MVIDTHSHIIPTNIVGIIRKSGAKFGASIQTHGDSEWMVHEQGYKYPLLPHFYNLDQKLQDMEGMNVDFTILSPAPPLFMYWIKKPLAEQFARLVNEGISEFVSKSPKNFLGMATVPMQDADAAIAELQYASTLPGIYGVEIGTTIEGKQLDDPSYEAFFSLCEELQWPIFLHPYYVGDKIGLQKYYLTNLIGNPLDSAIAASTLIFSGVLDRYPRLRIILAHGGGFFPYQIGRLDHGFSVRPESHTSNHFPSSYLTRFTYDCITFNVTALDFLIRQVGVQNVVIGSDYPFDMAEQNPVDLVSNTSATDSDGLRFITHSNAAKLFQLS